VLKSFGKFAIRHRPGDSPEDWVHGRDDSDEDEAEDQVHQVRGASPAGAGWVIKKGDCIVFRGKGGYTRGTRENGPEQAHAFSVG
jgi:hypothetical protein